MPHSFGYRARTRNKFQKGYKQKGLPSVGRYLTVFKKGDYVDIKVDPSIHKGMPYQYYHGRTGLVFNVTQTSIGVAVKKVVGNREILKRIHVRSEHLRKSRCNEDFISRVRENDAKRAEAKKRGEKLVLKRSTGQPKGSETVIPNKPIETFAPIKFVENF
uniref:60S ribosomal protein L21 n=1 Tax=Chromera velia CCMP2878 TaxID=1169474 RepID=A0A0G4FJ82_9ALVE|mmetsp:Transcript_47952/g.94626  ORF Transcript_47952/g.94626 Transcript_47952/m.94626 type:complete len:160 (+) Transcript_47952:43-522(+)|eukprot:Cvel_17262.t1-p1 / transcript=Cvel_17262.t1 / gene=Cvel_17262 / organism=Chromera_velia_CCMP2878 / gene_product=60S ribosomal protein L21-B, putative / transcript_product=60S ribosomal protein L21-B, putative / location=Cvel_scaffold1368:11334-11897(+) / protein_length=159 / sequence_SO=supercontig / SO=protein_coding / is_pseudo=false